MGMINNIIKNSLLKSKNNIFHGIDNLNEEKPINERILIIGDKVKIQKSDRKLRRFKNFKDIIGKEGIIKNEEREFLWLKLMEKNIKLVNMI